MPPSAFAAQNLFVSSAYRRARRSFILTSPFSPRRSPHRCRTSVTELNITSWTDHIAGGKHNLISKRVRTFIFCQTHAADPRRGAFRSSLHSGCLGAITCGSVCFLRRGCAPMLRIVDLRSSALVNTRRSVENAQASLAFSSSFLVCSSRVLRTRSSTNSIVSAARACSRCSRLNRWCFLRRGCAPMLRIVDLRSSALVNTRRSVENAQASLAFSSSFLVCSKV